MRKRREMTCEEFSARMAQLVASGQDIFAHPHVKRCRMHRALLEDLEAIACAARQLFPDVDPSDALWQRINDDIAATDWFPQRISDPSPGFRLVSRVRVEDKSRHVSSGRNQDTGSDSRSIPSTRLRVVRSGTPPCHGEGR